MRGPQLRPLGIPVGDVLAQICHVSVDERGKLFPREGVVAVPCDFGDDEESGEYVVEEEIWACDRRGPCDSFDSLEPFAV